MEMQTSRVAISLVGVVLLTLMVGWMTVSALSFTRSARILPLIIGAPTTFFLVVQIVRDIRAIKSGTFEPAYPTRDDGYVPEHERATPSSTTNYREIEQPSLRADQPEIMSVGVAFLWIASLIAIIWIVGIVIAVPIYMALFMRLYGRDRWTTVLLYSLGMLAFIYFFFVFLLGLRPFPGVFDLLPARLII